MTPSRPGLKSLSDIGVPDLSAAVATGWHGPCGGPWVPVGAFCTVDLADVRGVRHHDHVVEQVLVPGGDHDGETCRGDLSGQDAGTARFLECRFEGCDLSEVGAPRARFSETGLYA